MRQDVHQVYLLGAFSCPCAGGDVQGVTERELEVSETIVLEGSIFHCTMVIGGRVFDKGNPGFCLFGVSMFFFDLLPQS